MRGRVLAGIALVLGVAGVVWLARGPAGGAPELRADGAGPALGPEPGARGEPRALAPAHLELRLREASGEPARGVRVALRAPAEPGLAGEWTATADDGGACAFELPPQVGFAAELARDGGALLRPGEDESGALRFAPGERASREWTLRAGCRLTGAVIDQDERVIPELELELRECATARAEACWSDGLAALSAGGSSARAVSGRDGNFAFDGIPPGGWALFVRGGEDLPRAAYLFRVTADQRARHLRLVLPRGLSVSGRVLDAEGAPFAGAELELVGLDAAFEARGQSRSDGKFALGPLLAGRYRLEARGTDISVPATSVVRAGAEKLELRLQLGGVLRVRVADESGAPVVARLELRGPSARAELGSDVRLARLAPGRYVVVARAEDGRIAVVQDVAVESGLAAVPLALVVRPGCALRLRLRGDERRLWRVTWSRATVASGWLEPEAEASLTVPPGPVSVSWWSAPEENGGARLQEEQRVLSRTDEVAVFGHGVPR